MSKLKNSLTDEQMDALGEVSEGTMTYEDFLENYRPYGEMDANSHDCNLESSDPNDGCSHPVHQSEPDGE